MTETRPIKSQLRRKFLGVPLIAWMLLAMAGTAIAAGVYWLTLGTTGQISLADGIEEGSLSFETGSEVVAGDCTAVVALSGDSIDIQATGLFAGDFCEVLVAVANSGTSDAAFNGFMVSESFSPNGELPYFGPAWGDDGNGNPEVNYCGAVIPAGGSAEIGIRLDVGGPEQIPGTFYDFASGDGFQFVPAGAENCG